jgi:hypothetical protein
VLGSDRVLVTVFSRPKPIHKFNGVPGTVLRDGLWRIACEARTDCVALQKRVGGVLVH